MPETAYDEIYENGVRISRTERTISDAEIERRDAPAVVRQLAQSLDAWADDAQAVADQAPNVSQAQLKALFARQAVFFRRMRKLLITLGVD